MNDPTPVRQGPGLVLRVAVWLGLLTGMAEVVVRGAERFLLHRFIRVDQHVLWMAPVMDLLWFLAIGAVLSLLLRLWPTTQACRIAMTTMLALAWLSLGLLWTTLDQRTALILALGLGMTVMRGIMPRIQQFDRLIRRTLPALGLILLLLFAVAFALPAWRERQALANAPLPAGRPPNVLLLVLDTVRNLSLSLYGYPRLTTPELSRWGQRGVVFERAFSAAPWTLPSHASMFTGRWPIELSAGLKRPLDDTYPTIAEAFAARGYRTAGFTANSQFTTYEQGLDRGFMRFRDFLISPSALFISTVYGRELVKRNWLRNALHYYDRPGRKLALEVNAEFLDWERSGNDRPFFAFLNYFDAHDPYRPPAPFDTTFGADPNRPWGDIQTGDPRKLPRGLLPREQDSYDASIRYLDHSVGRLLDSLNHRGVLDSTVVIIVSDHGEQFGEHNLMFHANSVYRQLLQVPLIVIYPPTVPAGLRLQEPISIRDLAQTMLGVAGGTPDSRFPGRSLASLWGPDSTAARAVPRFIWADNELIDGRRQFAILDPDWYFVRMPKPRSRTEHTEQLYDFRQDPEEVTDLAGSQVAELPMAKFRGRLEEMLSRSEQAQEQAAEDRRP